MKVNEVFRLEPISLEELRQAVGTEIGVSPWRVVSQEMIDKFADATDDHQFIHVDPVRAAAETTFGGTVAHGFLTLSLLSTMAYETLRPIKNSGIGVNQGFEELRFNAPVPSGSRIRAHFVLLSVNIRISGWVEMVYKVSIELEGRRRSVLTGRWLTLSFVPPEERE